jgi:anaerobic selenocysteine-containing dehydrogenase
MGETKVYKTACMLCFQVCGINAHIRDGKLVKVEGMAENPMSQGFMCARGINLTNFVYSPERIKYPMKKENGKWVRISWDDAMDTIAGKLKEYKQQYGARSVAFSVGSMGAEDIEISAFAQRLRGAFGTPNFFSIEAHCFRSRIMGRLLTFGAYPLEDPDNAELLILWGHNPDQSEPAIASKINKQLEQGLKLIVIDPRKISIANKGDYYRIKPGTDCALALGIMNVLITEGIYNKEFVEKYTMGFDKLAEHVREYTPEKVAEITEIAADDIRKIARMFAGAKATTIMQGIASLDQQINGLQTSRALAMLMSLTGNYAIPGAWVNNPRMRLTNLMVAQEHEEEPIGMGEYPLFWRMWGKAAPYGRQMDLPDVILSENPYPVKALISAGGNPALSWPDSNKVKQAFKKLGLLVVMDLFMTETAEMADIVLPACSFLESYRLAYNYALVAGISYAMLSKRVIEPIGESWPNWKFYSELGRRLGYEEYFPWNSDEEVVENFLDPSGMTFKQLNEEHPEGMYFGSRCYDINAKGQINTPSGKIEFYSETLAEAGYDPMPVHKEPTQTVEVNPDLVREYPLTLLTGARMLEYTNYQMKNIPQIRQLAPDSEVDIHPDTAAALGVADNEMIQLETRHGQILSRINITEDIGPGVVSIPHGWGGNSNANILTEMKPADPITGYPELKILACRIRKI